MSQHVYLESLLCKLQCDESAELTRCCRRITDSYPPPPPPSSRSTSLTTWLHPSSESVSLSSSVVLIVAGHDLFAWLQHHVMYRFASVLFTEKLILLPPSYLPNQVAALVSSFLPCTPATSANVVACLERHRSLPSPPPPPSPTAPQEFNSHPLQHIVFFHCLPPPHTPPLP